MSSASIPAPEENTATSGAVEYWTIQKILQWSTDFLKTKGSPTARLDAEILIAHTLGLTRIQLYTGFDKPVLEREREPLRDYLRRRAAGEPVAYITRQKEFRGLSFSVSPAVLIPRPDTEVLIDAVQQEFKGESKVAPSRLLDVGTGSGCIAISLGKTFLEAEVTAWDISDAALEVAQKNRDRLDAPNVSFQNVDARSPRSWEKVQHSYDVIVSNPPYISQSERAELSASVRDFEPEVALFADRGGLEFYQVLAKQAGLALRANGLLFLEIGKDQAQPVTTLLAAEKWRNIEVLKDFGRHDRVVKAMAPLQLEGMSHS